MARFFVIFTLLVIVVWTTGCSRTILQSTRQNPTTYATQPNTIGYYLPKGLIRISLKKDPKSDEYIFDCTSEIVPDPQHFFSLEYNPSIFSSDGGSEPLDPQDSSSPKMMKISVNEKGLLTSISAHAQDQTEQIITNLVNALTLTPKSDATPRGRVKAAETFKLADVIEVSFDPDNPTELKDINNSLKPLNVTVKVKRLAAGLPQENYAGSPEQRGIYYRPCLPYVVTIQHPRVKPSKNYFVVNGDGSVALHFSDPDSARQAEQAIKANFFPKIWDSKPGKTGLEKFAIDAKMNKATEDQGSGNTYVINIDGSLTLNLGDPSNLNSDVRNSIKENFQPKPNDWLSLVKNNTPDLINLARLAGLDLYSPDQGFWISKVFQLPNQSPVLSVDVLRSPFITKKYDLKFMDGILWSYRMEKPSEVLAGLNIPINVAKALVALPANVVSFKVNMTTKAIQLQKAQADLSAAQRAFQDALVKARQPGPGTPGGRTFEAEPPPKGPPAEKTGSNITWGTYQKRSPGALDGSPLAADAKVNLALIQYLQAIENLRRLSR